MSSTHSRQYKFTGDPGLESLSPPHRLPGATSTRNKVSGPFPRDGSSSTVGSRLPQLRQEDALARAKTSARTAREEPYEEASFAEEVGLNPPNEALDVLGKHSVEKSESANLDGNAKHADVERVALSTNVSTQSSHIPPPTGLERNEYRYVQPGAVAVNHTLSDDDLTIIIGGDEQDVSRDVRALSSEAPPPFSAEILIPEATLVPENENQSPNANTRIWTQRKRMTILLSVVIVVAAAVTIGVVIGTRDSDSSSDPPCGDGIIGNGICVDGLCCSEFGFCGATEEFCGDMPLINSTSDGFCGNGNMGNGTCAGGLCCSDFGFCGSTAEFCTNGQEIPNANGFCGGGIVGNGTCAGGLCCSNDGFCGVTAAFCVNGQTPP